MLLYQYVTNINKLIKINCSYEHTAAATFSVASLINHKPFSFNVDKISRREEQKAAATTTAVSTITFKKRFWEFFQLKYEPENRIIITIKVTRVTCHFRF